MKTAAAMIAFMVWSLLVFGGGYELCRSMRDAAEATKQAQTQDKEVKTKARKDRKALAAGLRTEQANAAADTAFQQIRADYEDDKRNKPGIGCVLDADSLRRWNDANAQSDGAAPGEPAGAVPAAADAETGRERGGQPHRDGAPVSALPEQDSRLD